MPTLNDFRSNFFGVRPNRFVVETVWPTEVPNAPDVTNLYIYVKGADLPGSSIGTINVAWQGRVVKFSGERSYADWVINVYDSNIPSKDLRTGFERWIEVMDGRNTHQINYNVTSDWIIRYSDVVVGEQYTDLPTQAPQNFNKAVKLKNCFPTDIAPVTLNYDVADTFTEFTVQVAYDYWLPVGDNE